MTEEHIGGDVEAAADGPPEGDAVAELEAESSAADATEPGVRTGVTVVDDVLGTLEGLDDLPVEEHLPIFEAAHEQLREALDGAEPSPEPDPEPQAD